MLRKRKLIFYLKTFNVYIRYKLNKNFKKLSSFFGIGVIPFAVYINVTTACNLKCPYCVISKEKSQGFPTWNKKKNKKMSINLLRSAIYQIAGLGIPFISLTGGEPLLIKDIDKIGELAMKKRVVINLNTNGTLIDERNAEKLANSFDFIRVSLNGPERLHDSLTNVEGSYKKTFRAIKLLVEVKNRKSKVGVNCILNKSTINLLPNFIEKIKNGIDFIGILPEFSFDQLSDYLISLTPEERILINKLNNIKEVRPKIDLKDFKLIRADNCDAGWLYVYVTPEGKVLQCPFITEKMVLHSNNYSKKDIWNLNKHKLKDICDNLKTKRLNNCIGCYANCTTGITRVFNTRFYQLIKNWFYYPF